VWSDGRCTAAPRTACTLRPLCWVSHAVSWGAHSGGLWVLWLCGCVGCAVLRGGDGARAGAHAGAGGAVPAAGGRGRLPHRVQGAALPAPPPALHTRCCSAVQGRGRHSHGSARPAFQRAALDETLQPPLCVDCTRDAKQEAPGVFVCVLMERGGRRGRIRRRRWRRRPTPSGSAAAHCAPSSVSTRR
jgi:hypothetical protein